MQPATVSRFLVLVVAAALATAGCASKSGSSAKAPRKHPAVIAGAGGAATGKVEALKSVRFADSALVAEDRPAVVAPSPDPDLERRAEAHAAFARAVIAEDEGAREEALTWYGRAVRNDSTNELLAIEVTRGWVARKQFAKAAEVLKPTAIRPGSSLMSRSLYGGLLAQTGQTNAALAWYRDLLTDHPTEISLYRSVFDLQGGMRNPAANLRLLDRASAQTVTNAVYWLEVAELLQRLASPTNVPPTLRRRLDLALVRADSSGPLDTGQMQRLVDIYTSLGENKKAESTLKRLRERAPGSAVVAAELVEILLKEGKVDEARQQLEALAKRNPADPAAPFYLGIVDFQEKDYEQAVAHFKRAVNLKPDFEPAYSELAAAQLNIGQQRQALETIDQARVWFGDSFRREYLAAVAHGMLKEFDDALKHYRKAEEVARAHEPGQIDYRFYFQVGSTLEQAGKSDEAVAYVKKALAIKPDFDEALNYLGYTYAERGENLAQAREMIEKAVRQQPDNAAFLDSLAWVLYRQGHPAEALSQIEKALKLMPDTDATVEDHFGDILEAVGRHDDAKAAWQRSLSVEENPVIRKKLAGSEK